MYHRVRYHRPAKLVIPNNRAISLPSEPSLSDDREYKSQITRQHNRLSYPRLPVNLPQDKIRQVKPPAQVTYCLPGKFPAVISRGDRRIRSNPPLVPWQQEHGTTFVSPTHPLVSGSAGSETSRPRASSQRKRPYLYLLVPVLQIHRARVQCLSTSPVRSRPQVGADKPYP